MNEQMQNKFRHTMMEERRGVRSLKVGMIIAISVAICAITAPILLQSLIAGFLQQDEESGLEGNAEDKEYGFLNKVEEKYLKTTQLPFSPFAVFAFMFAIFLLYKLYIIREARKEAALERSLIEKQQESEKIQMIENRLYRTEEAVNKILESLEYFQLLTEPDAPNNRQDEEWQYEGHMNDVDDALQTFKEMTVHYQLDEDIEEDEDELYRDAPCSSRLAK